MMGPFLYHSWPIFSATPRVSHHKTERSGLTAAARATVVLCICCGFPTVFFPPPFSGKQWENHGFSHYISANYGNLRNSPIVLLHYCCVPTIWDKSFPIRTCLSNERLAQASTSANPCRSSSVGEHIPVPRRIARSCRDERNPISVANGLIYYAGVFHIDRYIICYIYVYIYIHHIHYIYSYTYICIYVYLAIYLSTYLPLYLSIYLPTYWYLSIYPYIL